MSPFRLVSPFSPTGDQPQAIEKLAANLQSGVKHQTLLGVTGSGKTFTMANLIARLQKPALVISHNKTLAAQLYQEFKDFFPDNAVHYFVSYYDYYQPEAYIPSTDTYIEKDAKINDTIDALRHASTASLLTRSDVLIVASVSCIYGIGDPQEYEKASIELGVGKKLTQKDLVKKLIALQYARNPIDPRQGHFRIRENTIEIYLPSNEGIISVEIEHNHITNLRRANSHIVRDNSQPIRVARLFPAKHFVTPQEKLDLALANIREELSRHLAELKRSGKILESARLKQRTEYDLEMIKSMGYVTGIENYSRHLDFRAPGTPPHTLLDYFHHTHGNDFLIFIDESHATIPQLRGMERGDKARKDTLIDFGFRLPSARDNRPLTFDEFNNLATQLTYVSATPGAYEFSTSQKETKHLQEKNLSPKTYHLKPIVEQLIRPTGILDPAIEIRPTATQVRDTITEIKKRIAKNQRSLVMVLTKRLAEDMAEYLQEAGINAEYLHADIKTLERPGVLKKLRTGEHDAIVGINLLREGLDLPEVSFIAILDADKEGFLRNETTLLQIIGRAARHTEGTVILYADTMTGSMKAAINETNRRRKIQQAYNHVHNITPKQITKEIRQTLLEELAKDEEDAAPAMTGTIKEVIKELERQMKKAAKSMDFELAAKLRDQIKRLQTSKAS